MLKFLNKLDEKINSMDKVNLNVEVPKDKNIINNVIALFVTFIMFNVKWIKYKIEFFGYESSTSITVLVFFTLVLFSFSLSFIINSFFSRYIIHQNNYFKKIKYSTLHKKSQ